MWPVSQDPYNSKWHSASPPVHSLTLKTLWNLLKSLTSCWLLYGSIAGHWLISGIDRFLARWLESHGIKLVLTNIRIDLKIHPTVQGFVLRPGLPPLYITYSCSWSSRTMASSSFFSSRLWLCSSSSRAFSLLLSVSAFFSWDSRKRTSSSR